MSLRGYFELKPRYHSHRNPFRGFGAVGPGNDPRVNMIEGAARSAATIKAPAADATAADARYVPEGLDIFDRDLRTEIDVEHGYNVVRGYDGYEEYATKFGPALLRGAISGLVTWGIARAVGAQAPMARKIAIVSGVMEAGVSLAGTFLRAGLEPAPVAPAAQLAVSAQPVVKP